MVSVRLSETEGDHRALVLVPEGELSLAIGKRGQNVRLAAKLTGWRIDVEGAQAPKEAAVEAEAAEEVAALVDEVPSEPVAETTPAALDATEAPAEEKAE